MAFQKHFVSPLFIYLSRGWLPSASIPYFREYGSCLYAGKNHILFERQKHLLEEFLVRNAISREQYEKKTMDEGVSASFLNEWNGSRNHREKIYFSYDSTDKKCQAAVKLSDIGI